MHHRWGVESRDAEPEPEPEPEPLEPESGWHEPELVAERLECFTQSRSTKRYTSLDPESAPQPFAISPNLGFLESEPLESDHFARSQSWKRCRRDKILGRWAGVGDGSEMRPLIRYLSWSRPKISRFRISDGGLQAPTGADFLTPVTAVCWSA